MSFLSGFYTRLSGTFSRPNEDGLVTVVNVAHSDSANSNDASSRTLSPEDDKGDVDTPEKVTVSATQSRIPPTPSFAPPATPFAGQASPVVNRAAAEQLMREAGASAPTPALKPTPFFGVFAPPHTPAARNLSPVRNQAAEEQLMREMLDEVPETPAPIHLKAGVTPMTLYKTPAASHITPTEPSTEQSLAADAFQTPSIMPSRLQLQSQSPIQEESEIVFENIEQRPQSSKTKKTEKTRKSRQHHLLTRLLIWICPTLRRTIHPPHRSNPAIQKSVAHSSFPQTRVARTNDVLTSAPHPRATTIEGQECKSQQDQEWAEVSAEEKSY
jgi:hypothetical protein